MNTNEKRELLPQSETGSKGTHISTTMQVLAILKTMQKVTALGLNRAVNFNDSRKAVSILINEYGYPIQSYRLADQRKVYYLPQEWEQIMEEVAKNKPLDLFANESV